MKRLSSSFLHPFILSSLHLFILPSFHAFALHAEDITIHYNGQHAKVTQNIKDSVTVNVVGTTVNIDSRFEQHKLTVLLKGKSDNAQLVLKTQGKAKVTLHGVEITSNEGAPLVLKNKKKVEINTTKGTTNTLTVTACNDTVNHKAAVIWAKDKILLSGKGTLNAIATGDGCRGIKSKKDITIQDIRLNITTSGNNLGEKAFAFGGLPGFTDATFPGFGNDSTNHGTPPPFPAFHPDSIPEDMKKQFEEMRHHFQEMMAGDSTNHGTFPPFPDFSGFPARDENDSIQGGFPAFGGKHKYVAPTKGIASKGKITINSGNVTVRTSTPGAEGIEGKEGIIFNGGNVDVISPDDAINAGGCIEFNGAHVIARSTGNDAVDSNPKDGFFSPFGSQQQSNEPAIIIRGGTVYAWSQVGAPEEGLDCDFAPIIIEGGKVFSIGGGMGEMPSVPTNDTAQQPTALLIGLNIMQDEPVTVCDDSGHTIDTIKPPFSLRRSASLVSSPAFQKGNTYTVKTKGYERTFTLQENFTVVR